MPTLSSVLVVMSLLGANPHAAFELSGSLEREVVFQAFVSCEGDGDGAIARDVRVHAALPESSARQDVEVLETRPEGRRERDVFGNLLHVVERAELKPGERFEVTWRARVRIRNVTHTVDRSKLLPLSAAPRSVAEAFLCDGDVYCVGDPVLKQVAASARAAASDPLDLAFRLNELVRERISYERDGKWDPAPDVWRDRRGSCSEYHFVFASLCRNAGLPVRYVGATALREDVDEYVDTVYHRWSEVYLPGHGWFPVDVSRNDGEDESTTNRSFGRTDCRLLELVHGDGGKATPLGWGYVASVKARVSGGASVRDERRVTWRRAATSGG